MPKLRLTILMAIVAALLAVGCGGSSDSGATAGGETASAGETSSTEAAATVPKAVFIKEADAICANGRKQTESKFATYLKENGIKEIGEAGESSAETKAREVEVIETLGIPALQKQQEELRELHPPKGEEASFETYLDAGQKSIEESEANPDVLYNAPQKVFAEPDKLAKEIGFKVCGNR